MYEWKHKFLYVLLMNTLTAIRKGNNDQSLAIRSFENVWMKRIEYWKNVRPQDNLVKEVLDI